MYAYTFQYMHMCIPPNFLLVWQSAPTQLYWYIYMIYKYLHTYLRMCIFVYLHILSYVCICIYFSISPPLPLVPPLFGNQKRLYSTGTSLWYMNIYIHTYVFVYLYIYIYLVLYVYVYTSQSLARLAVGTTSTPTANLYDIWIHTYILTYFYIYIYTYT